MSGPAGEGVNPLALELLEEAEREPSGWSFLDVEKLLDLWGVTEPLPGADVVGYRSRAHPEFRNDYVYYPLLPELAPPIVLGICRWLRRLKRRMEAG